MTGLPLSADWKNDNYNFILIIVNRLTKMVPYKSVKITTIALKLAKVILDVVVWHYGLSNSIVNNSSLLFISKFWSSLCYFLGVKRRLLTAFHSQTDSQTKQQNSTIKVYFRAFINFEQNDWAKFLLIAEFA